MSSPKQTENISFHNDKNPIGGVTLEADYEKGTILVKNISADNRTLLCLSKNIPLNRYTADCIVKEFSIFLERMMMP